MELQSLDKKKWLIKNLWIIRNPIRLSMRIDLLLLFCKMLRTLNQDWNKQRSITQYTISLGSRNDQIKHSNKLPLFYDSYTFIITFKKRWDESNQKMFEIWYSMTNKIYSQYSYQNLTNFWCKFFPTSTPQASRSKHSDRVKFFQRRNTRS